MGFECEKVMNINGVSSLLLQCGKGIISRCRLQIRLIAIMLFAVAEPRLLITQIKLIGTNRPPALFIKAPMSFMCCKFLVAVALEVLFSDMYLLAVRPPSKGAPPFSIIL